MTQSEVEDWSDDDLANLPDNEMLDAFPLTYYAEAGTFGVEEGGQDDCKVFKICNNIEIELKLISRIEGVLTVRIHTYDKTGNVSDTSDTVLSSVVALYPAKPILINAKNSRDYVVFKRAIIKNGFVNAWIRFHDHYVITGTDGRVCNVKNEWLYHSNLNMKLRLPSNS